MTPETVDASQLLQTARERAGLTQRQLARKARTAQSVVARIELGETSPSWSTLARLLKAAGFSLSAGLRRISKPGLRVYAKSTNLPRVLGGLGVAIISTSSGLLTDRQAGKKGVGGEVLAYVW